METDLCEVGPSDAAYQFQNSSSATAASYRPIVPEGGVEINLHAAEASDTPSQARGGSSEGSLEQPITEQRGIGTDFCEVRPSDTPYQVQDGSSGTASQLPIPEQRGSEADLCEAEALPEHQEGRKTTEK
jgi:senataxin